MSLESLDQLQQLQLDQALYATPTTYPPEADLWLAVIAQAVDDAAAGDADAQDYLGSPTCRHICDMLDLSTATLARVIRLSVTQGRSQGTWQIRPRIQIQARPKRRVKQAARLGANTANRQHRGESRAR